MLGGLFHRFFGCTIDGAGVCFRRPFMTLSKARFQMEVTMPALLARLWPDDKGQDIAEYAVMLAAILVLVVGTIRLVGSNANNAFSAAASAMQ